MKYIVCALLLAIMSACSGSSSESNAIADTTATVVAENPTSEWKLGIALWTFHSVNIPEALDKVDSAGIKYIEPNTFHKSGPELNDTMIMQLSTAGIEKLKTMIAAKGLKCESLYIVGGPTIDSWKKQFEVAKQMGVRFVTSEPDINLWDAVDSLAGVYGIKVAIHEHWKGMSHYWNPDTTLMALKGRKNFGVCADLGHWPKSGVNPLDAVKKLSGHIIAIHLKDIAAYNDPKLLDVPIGTGVVDFPAIFEELKKQGFKGPMYIERDATDQPSNLPSVIQSVKYFNEQVIKLK